jgi:hypothetical protein
LRASVQRAGTVAYIYVCEGERGERGVKGRLGGRCGRLFNKGHAGQHT